MARGVWPLFSWGEVQDQPFVWSLNATLAELAPLVWNYYVESRSEVSLFAAIQGAGYMYPSQMTLEQFEPIFPRLPNIWATLGFEPFISLRPKV